MSKITFRADEELVERIEARDTSKSEIMREALREYLDDSGADSSRETAAADPAREGHAGHERAAHEHAGRASATRDRDAGAAFGSGGRRTADSIDALLVERVDELVGERLAAWEARADERSRSRAQDVNVNLTLESDAAVRPTAESEVARDRASDGRAADARTSDDQSSDGRASDAATSPAESDAVTGGETACGQCGESLSDDHVYCPNCGEKAARRVFCECGDEVRSDWGFCPSCGRRTPAADVLDRS